MSANTAPIFPVSPRTANATITSANGTDKVQAVTAGTNGARLDQVRICSSETVQVVLQFFSSLDGGTTWAILGEVQVAAGSGTDGSTSWLEALDFLNAGYSMALAAGEILGAVSKTDITSGKTVTISSRYGDF